MGIEIVIVIRVFWVIVLFEEKDEVIVRCKGGGYFGKCY